MSATTVRSDAGADARRCPSPFTLLQRSDTASIIVLLFFTVVLLWPVVSGKPLYWGDIMLYFEPMQRFAAAELRLGRLPLWNPYLLCGQPFLGNPQMGVFYPLTLLTPFVSASHYIAISTVLHIFLCGLFMYIYLRKWVRWKLSALCAAVAYMGSTCIVARIQFPPMIVSACYCPLILAFIDACLERFTIRRWLGLSGAIGLLVLSAHPQMAYFTLLIGSIYAACRVWLWHSWLGPGLSASSTSIDTPRNRPMRTLWQFASAACLGLAFAGAQLAPMLELMRVSTRERMTPTLANRFVFDLSHLATLVFPNSFGNPATADYFGGGTAWEPGVFIGWLPLAAVAYAIAVCHKSPPVRFWLVAAALSFWVSTGTAGGLFWAAFYVVPGLSNFHDPARFLFIATVSMCVLTSVGMDAWQRRVGETQRWSAVAIMLVTAVPLIWFGSEWNPTTRRGLDQNASHKHAGMDGRSYLPGHDLYWRRFVTEGYSDYGPESNISLILNSDTPNGQMREGIETAAGYEPVPVSGPAEVDGLARIAVRRGEPTLVSLLRTMDATNLLLPDYRVLYNADYTNISAPKWLHSDATVVLVNQPFHWAWLVPAAVHVEGKTRAEAAIAGPDFDPTTVAIVSGLSASQTLNIPERATGQSLPMREVQIESRSSTFVKLFVDAGATPALMVYSGACYPGWKAKIDERPTQVYCADVAFMGVEVPRGKHHVVLFYSPTAVRLGIFILALALLVSAALATLYFANQISASRIRNIGIQAAARRSRKEAQ